MEETVTRHSTVFPPGYGDFALEASDGLICHFPRHLLAYMSETFRDMFSLPAGQTHSNESQTPLKVAEPGQILELFLRNIDPKQPTPPIDLSTIVPLLDVAEKYQVSAITKWFVEEATVKHERKHMSRVSILEPFVATHPVLALYCAVHFNLPSIGRFAFREFARCDVSRTWPTGPYFDTESYLEASKLRENRREHFDKLITSLATTKAGSTGHMIDICTERAHSLATWVAGLEIAIRKAPNWQGFIRAYDQRYPDRCCTCATPSWPDYFRGEIATWERKTMTAESLLPAWPF